MNKEKYLEMRNALMGEAEALVNEGKIEDANAKMEKVEALDSDFEASAKAQANISALKDNVVITNIADKSAEPIGGQIMDKMNAPEIKDEQAIYLNAWAKDMMGQSMTNEESEVFNKVNAEFHNAYTHTTGNTSTLIPTTVAAGIWARATEAYPLLGDVKKYSVQGTLVINKHTSIDAGDAAWYTEGNNTADEQNTFGQITLTGCELAKAITVSWKLKSMAVDEFLPYIQKELGDRIGVALGTAMFTGSGVAGEQPQGVITAINAEGGTPQKITYTADSGVDPLEYTKITAAIAKIHSSYTAGCAIYATNATIWGTLANLLDAVGRPIFVPDVTGGGVGRMFGMPVKADAGAGTGNILIGNASAGYVMNVNEPLSIATEDHVKDRTTDYAGYTVVDGKVLDTQAFVLLDLI